MLLADAGWLRPGGALVLGATALGVGVVWPGPRRACAALLALAAGALALGLRLDGAARARPGAPVELRVEGRVAERTRGPGWTRLDLDRVAAVEPGRAPRRLRLHLDETAPGFDPLERRGPGAWLRAALRLRAPRAPANPGARSADRELARRGIGAQARLVHPALHVRLPRREGLRPLAGLHRERERLAGGLLAAGPGGGLLAALALGDRRGLDAGSRDAFARLGISHLLAVSGLHLVLVAAASYALGRGALRRSAFLAARCDTRRLALGVALAAALGYALLAGWGVPVRRAWVLLLAAALAVLRSRPGRRGDPLAAAALWILAVEPDALFRPGAQLSFAATAALVCAPRRQRPAGQARFRGRAADALRASATAISATAPLAAWQLGASAPFALAVNGLAIPWTGLVLLPAALLASAALSAGLPLADGMLAVAERAAAASLAAAAELARLLPAGAGRGTPDPSWLLAAVVLGALGIASRGGAPRVAAAVGVGLLLAAAPTKPVAPGVPRLAVLDVGQGDAVLVQGRRGAILVDAGSARPGGPDLGRSVVVPALRALGLGRLDLLVASHADLDHRGGLPAVLASVPVGALWLPAGAGDDPGMAGLRAAARERGVPVRERAAGAAPQAFGDLRVEVLWPPPGATGSRNDRSLVLRVEVEGRRVLLPGDVEAAAEAALLSAAPELRADVLLLPHHGSRSSSTAAFLDAVDPLLAIASAPERGRFGMPHASVRQRVAQRRASLWWTGRDGAVLVGLGRPLWVRGFRHDAGRLWLP